MSSVTFNGTRLNNADSSTGFGNRTGGGPSPASEPQLRYQGSGAVNRKVNSTSARQGIEYSHGSTFDMTGASFPLWFCKLKVGDASDVNAIYGVEATLGSSSAARHEYNLSGSGANNDQYSSGYNSQGGLAEGYIITGINPNIAQWREATSGSPALASVDYFAVAAQFVTGGAKSENVAIDAIDLGVGLDYNGADFSFSDGPTADQDIVSNRWGAACRNGTDIALRGLHRIGPSSSTSGADISSVRFPDGYHGTGDCGIEYNTTNASASLDGDYVGLGRLYGADDTRPDLTFVGTGANSSTHAGNFGNFNAVSLLSSITMTGSVECASLAQSGATLTGLELQVNTVVNVACCSDFTVGNTSGLKVVQVGAGHFADLGNIASSTSITWTVISEGFPAGTAGLNTGTANGDELLLVSVASGQTLTISVADGATVPSVKNDGAGNVNVVAGQRSYTVTGLVPGSEVLIIEDTGSPATAPVYGAVESSGSTFSISYTHTVDINVRVIVHSLTQEYVEFSDVLVNADKSIPVQQRFDRNYRNPA